LLAAPAGLK
jgi:hypothetical protein